VRRGILISAVTAAAVFSAVAGASAATLPNGGFEQGSLSGWGYRAVSCGGIVASHGAGASGGVVATPNWGTYGGSFSLDLPYGGAFIGAPFGSHAALFSQSGPSWGILHRGFRVPRSARYLNFDLLWVNQALVGAPVRSPARSRAATPRGAALDIGRWIRPSKKLRCPSTATRQYAQVDLLRAGASPRSLKKKDILAKIWRPLPGITLANSGNWTKQRISLKKFRGQRVRLRIAVIDTAGYLNVAVDRLVIRP
jgi:hypothetical protein